MKAVKLLLISITFLVFSCSGGDSSSDDSVPINQTPNDNPPVGLVTFCDVNTQLMPIIGQYGDNGLSISIDLPADVSMAEVNDYGFMLKRTYDSKEFKYDLSDTGSENFDSSIVDLIHGFEYEVTGYAIIDGKICYTNSESFEAQENYPLSPWSVMAAELLYKNNTYGITVGGEPYVLLENFNFYKINEDGSLERKANYPSGVIGYGDFTIFDLDGFAYVKRTSRNEIYRYDKDLDTWDEVGVIYNNTGKFSGQLEGIGYTFSNVWGFSYVPGDCCFFLLGEEYYTTTELRSTFQTKTDIYAINREYEILLFDKFDGTFSVIANYPGEKLEYNNDIVTLVQGNKAYIGLDVKYNNRESTNFHDIYELNLDTLEWKELEPFPVPFVSTRGIGQVNGELYSYIFFRDWTAESKGYVWRFDPTKVAYLGN
nr:hypothetical protein [uncultured Allomuricauda sp.]